MVDGEYTARRLTAADAEALLALCRGNALFYRYHPPAATRESLLQDMTALPPGKTAADKYYVGFFAEERLIAVLDLILRYPEEQTALIGFFMVEAGAQGHGVGSRLIGKILRRLQDHGVRRVRLAVDRGNPQSMAFWSKNGFERTGEEIPNGFSAYLPMERPLQPPESRETV